MDLGALSGCFSAAFFLLNGRRILSELRNDEKRRDPACTSECLKQTIRCSKIKPRSKSCVLDLFSRLKQGQAFKT